MIYIYIMFRPFHFHIYRNQKWKTRTGEPPQTGLPPKVCWKVWLKMPRVAKPQKGPKRNKGRTIRIKCAYKKCRKRTECKSKRYYLPIAKVNKGECRSLRGQRPWPCQKDLIVENNHWMPNNWPTFVQLLSNRLGLRGRQFWLFASLQLGSERTVLVQWPSPGFTTWRPAMPGRQPLKSHRWTRRRFPERLHSHISLRTFCRGGWKNHLKDSVAHSGPGQATT